MKKYFIAIAVIVVAAGAYLLLSGGSTETAMVSPTPTDTVAMTATPTATPEPFTDGSYALVASSSSAQWAGAATALKAYTLNVSNGTVGSGSLAVDMAALNSSLYSAKKYPTAVFTFATIAPNASGSMTASGTLTLKGIAKRVSFPVSVVAHGNTITMTADKIPLSRATWSITSPDKSLSDTFMVSFTAVGTLNAMMSSTPGMMPRTSVKPSASSAM